MTCVDCEVSRIGAIASVASKTIPPRHVEVLNFMFPPYVIAVRTEEPRCRSALLHCTVADAGIQPGKNKPNPWTPPIHRATIERQEKQGWTFADVEYSQRSR